MEVSKASGDPFRRGSASVIYLKIRQRLLLLSRSCGAVYCDNKVVLNFEFKSNSVNFCSTEQLPQYKPLIKHDSTLRCRV